MQFGIDRLAQETELVSRLRNSRVGLLAHPASVDRDLAHASDVMAKIGVVPRIFFGPEHGYGGEAQDMIGVADARDGRTGARIVSLYGDDFASLSPSAKDLAEIDLLVVDLADVGSRYYTFVWTALLAVRAASKVGVHTLILDRPNPLGARLVEGGPVHDGFRSFVGLESIPVRHGLTVGEIVAYFAQKDGLTLGAGGALSVLPSLGVTDDDDAWTWDRPFVTPSPNMPTRETALVYPGGCLIEGTLMSEGRGLTRPFEIVGAPYVDGRRLAEGLAKTQLPGFYARPITFFPMFQKHGRAMCGGVQIHVTDRAIFQPYATYVALTALVAKAHPDAFRFRTEKYEFIDDIPAFDLLTGSAEARQAIERGDDAGELARAIAKPMSNWDDVRAEARRALNACEPRPRGSSSR